MKTRQLTAERLRELLDYDPETGAFYHRRAQGGFIKIGARAGCKHRSGRIWIKVDQVIQMGHRLAWLHVYGVWPENDLDHINRDMADNRIANLRECVDWQNQGNTTLSPRNTSGRKGVCWAKDTGKWQAQIRKHGRSVYLGQFDEIDEAAKAYESAAKEHFGEFARIA